MASVPHEYVILTSDGSFLGYARTVEEGMSKFGVLRGMRVMHRKEYEEMKAKEKE